MDYKIRFKEMLDENNNYPCPYCGQTHHMDISYGDAVNEHLLHCSFSDDACERYRQAAWKRAELIAWLYNIPFSFLP